MPGFPDQPDLDQLRRQARELLRAAASNNPAAVARLRAVSGRMTLSASQLAVAREYGCSSWAALRVEVEHRRNPLQYWSFGGAAPIETLSGVLLPEGLVASADRAVLFTSLTPADNDAWRGFDGAWRDFAALQEQPSDPVEGSEPQPPDGAEARRFEGQVSALAVAAETGDITVTDDQGKPYALRELGMSAPPGSLPKSISFRVDPVPGRETGWLELAGQNGTTARLLAAPRAAVRVGRLTPVTAGPVEREPDRAAPPAVPGGLGQGGGPGRYLDLGITLPPIAGVTLHLASLMSVRDGWTLLLRATPRWFAYRDDQRRKWDVVGISAEDDTGRRYQCRFGGSSGGGGYEEPMLNFSPRVSESARRLRLTCAGSTGQITIDIDLTGKFTGRPLQPQ